MMRRSLRGRLVEHIRKGIERHGFPRLQMLLLVSLTGGAGSSGRFEEPTETALFDIEAPAPLEHAADAAGAADEFAIPVFVLVALASLLAGLLFVSFSIVYSAPVLFAELMLDGVLAATLYRRLRKLETRHWLETAVRRTFRSFLVAALVLMLAGWMMAQYVPEARSLGDVLARIGA